MARIALIDATPGIVTSLEAVAAEHEIVVCDRLGVPADVALVIMDINADAALGRDDDAIAESCAPTLLLVDRAVVIPEALGRTRGVSLLRKPFDLLELRHTLRALLGAASDETTSLPASASASATRSLDWLGSPVVPASVVPILKAALDLSTSLWLIGESGTGRQRVAGALLSRRRPSPRLISWRMGEQLETALSQCSDAARDTDIAAQGFALFVADVDTRTAGDQRRLEEFLAMHPDTLVIATAGDDPGEAVRAGTLSRSLYHLLSRLAVRLPPLRERRGDIAPLAQSLAAALAARCYGGVRVSFTDTACEKLELYPWPANLTELEGVITRSVIALAGSQHVSAAECVIDADDLIFAPALAAVCLGEGAQLAPAASGIRRSAVVLPLAPADGPSATAPARADATSTAIEAILAGLAHDLRNPLTTLNTFAQLTARATDGDDGDAQFAREAVAACTRIDTHIELLHEYAALPAPEATPLDLIALFAEAIEEARLPVAIAVDTQRSLWALVDRHHARFIAAAILDESRERLGEHDQARVEMTDSVIEVCIPRGGRAVEHLARWIDGDSCSWRLALAREVARRCGGDLELQEQQDELLVHWRAPLAEETSDGETGRIDRR